MHGSKSWTSKAGDMKKLEAFEISRVGHGLDASMGWIGSDWIGFDWV